MNKGGDYSIVKIDLESQVKPVSCQRVNWNMKGNFAGPVADDQFKVVWIFRDNSVDQVHVQVPDHHPEDISKIGLVIRIEAYIEFQIRRAFDMDGAPGRKVKSCSLVERVFMSPELQPVILTGHCQAEAY